jgi:hypothetical protein
MKDLQILLTQVSTVTKKNSEILDANGGRFNMFRILGVDHYEVTNSAILTELLSPKGSHGLKEKFLEAFANSLKLKDFIKEFDFKNATVKPEVVVGDGRIDILIDDCKSHAIIIENKIYAVDQWKQLKRYNDFAYKNYGAGNYKIFYLTLYGTEASKNSGEDVVYEQISYSFDVVQWLEQCVNLSSRFPLVRETINQYINHIKKLTNQDMDTKNSKEIVELLSKPENLDAAFIIGRNYSSLCKFIIDDIVQNKLKPQLDRFANENDLTLYELKGLENEIKIVYEKESWEKCRLIFHTEGSNIYGFTYKDPNQKIESSINEEIRKHLPRSKTSHWWPIWIRTDNFKNINMDVWMKEIKNGDFGEYVIRLFSQLLKIVQNQNI